MKDYVIPDGITSIGEGAFKDRKIESVTMGDSVTDIEGYAFSSCPNLKSVTLSASLKRFSGNNTFSNSQNLETVYFRSLMPPVYLDTQVSDFPKLTMYVPRQSLALYQASPYWQNFKQYFVGYDYDDIQDEPDYYVSSDYSQDGAVTVLQQATEGSGIDLILMGDGFSDRQIAAGSYDDAMRVVYENFFTEEPYKSYRHLFNVYAVTAVSATEGYDHDNTAIGGWFGEGTRVGGTDALAFNYAQNAIPAERMDEALIVVVMNIDAYAGTCYMYHPLSDGDYGKGVSVSYFPRNSNEMIFAELLHHEAGGHGFAKLADEYAYEAYGEIPSEYVQNYRQQQELYGWWKNVDFTADPTAVKWSRFLSDERYAYDGLGIFEGAFTFWTGAYRPTENSIMRYNTGGFNAPSREAIWYRLHKLAYGAGWLYDYEDFVAYDALNRRSEASAAPQFREPKIFRPLTPPVVVGRSWREAE